MEVPFGDLRREMGECGDDLRAAVASVLESGWFVLGPRLEAFEREFTEYLGGGRAVGVGSGTEALHLALVAAGVGHGDFVVTVPNTPVPTVSAISAAGATPILVDVDEISLTMCPEKLREVLRFEKSRLGGSLKAVIPVHLYGQSADLDPIIEVCHEFDTVVVEDACQAHGALYKRRKVGTFGDYGAFSFYPSKNLGCYGDGGAVVVSTPGGEEHVKMLRNYGQTRRYYHGIKGFNSRLDELQAAILSVKLARLDTWNARRRSIARSYEEGISNPAVLKPRNLEYSEHVFHLYAVRHPRRDALRANLAAAGVMTQIHYPVPIHLQPAYHDLGLSAGAFPVAEAAAAAVVSLPVFPQLTDEEVDYVCSIVNSAG